MPYGHDVELRYHIKSFICAAASTFRPFQLHLYNLHINLTNKLFVIRALFKDVHYILSPYSAFLLHYFILDHFSAIAIICNLLTIFRRIYDTMI